MLEHRDLEILRKMMREEIRHSENMILREVDRVQMRTENQIAELNRKADEMSQYYRFTRLESENIDLLFKLHEDLSKRVSELEGKTA